MDARLLFETTCARLGALEAGRERRVRQADYDGAAKFTAEYQSFLEKLQAIEWGTGEEALRDLQERRLVLSCLLAFVKHLDREFGEDRLALGDITGTLDARRELCKLDAACAVDRAKVAKAEAAFLLVNPVGSKRVEAERILSTLRGKLRLDKGKRKRFLVNHPDLRT
jgi:hypothetical protein